ncbi:hypothetical protein B0H14DRAFT_2862517, partial [Mycena olivaceomarginata]
LRGAPIAGPAPFVSYDERGHLVNYAYEGVASDAVPRAPVGQEHAPVYADAAAAKTYSPLLLDALPSLRREPVGGENYASSSLAGYAGRDGELDTPRTHARHRHRRRTGARATSCRTSITRQPQPPSPESISPTTGGAPRRCSSSRLRRVRHLPIYAFAPRPVYNSRTYT